MMQLIVNTELHCVTGDYAGWVGDYLLADSNIKLITGIYWPDNN
jgi:hypothetical protein